MFKIFAKRAAPAPAAALEQAFAARFAGRTLIVHAGLSPGWVAELLKEGGGGAHFRFDARRRAPGPPTPLEWVVQRHILPLACPLPLLVKVDADCLYLRHLTRGGAAVHPSEIAWMLDELPRRAHWTLRMGGAARAAHGIPLNDNRLDFGGLEGGEGPC